MLVNKTLRYLHQPFALFLSVYILTLNGWVLFAALLLQGFSESPICILPGISNLSLCRLWKPAPSQGSGPSGIASSSNLTRLFDAHEHTKPLVWTIITRIGRGSGLSLEIKKAEMATSDLVTRVRLSELNARDSIARALSEFVSGAKKTGRALQRLTSKVGGSVGQVSTINRLIKYLSTITRAYHSIMAVNEYALRAIEEGRTKEQSCWFPQCLMSAREAGRQHTDRIIAQTFETGNVGPID